MATGNLSGTILHKGQAYANQTLFVRQGAVNDFTKPAFKEFQTDANGKFSVELPYGK
jgi:hypothetical protein